MWTQANSCRMTSHVPSEEPLSHTTTSILRYVCLERSARQLRVTASALKLGIITQVRGFAMGFVTMFLRYLNRVLESLGCVPLAKHGTELFAVCSITREPRSNPG